MKGVFRIFLFSAGIFLGSLGPRPGQLASDPFSNSVESRLVLAPTERLWRRRDGHWSCPRCDPLTLRLGEEGTCVVEPAARDRRILFC